MIEQNDDDSQQLGMILKFALKNTNIIINIMIIIINGIYLVLLLYNMVTNSNND